MYTGGATDGSVAFDAIGSGTYVARAFENDGYTKLSESASFTVTGSDPGLTSDRGSYSSSDSAMIAFDHASGNLDWIAIGKVGSPTDSFYTWNYTGGNASGQLALSLADLPRGVYEARLFFNDSYQLEAKSAAFAVGGAAVTTNKSVYSAGESVSVTFGGFPGNANDWIAIAPAGSPSSQYTGYAYTNGSQGGLRDFGALAAGRYVTRAYFADGSTVQFESAPFTVGNMGPWVTSNRSTYASSETATIAFTGAAGDWNDWIGIAVAGSPESEFVAWDWTYSEVNGTTALPLTGLPDGTYVARLFVTQANTLRLESAPFTISSAAPPPPSGPSCSVTGAQFASGAPVTVSYDGLGGASSDWIAIAPVGSPDTSFVAYQYTGGGASGSKTFASLPAGDYVARCFANDSYQLQAASGQFSVAP